MLTMEFLLYLPPPYVPISKEAERLKNNGNIVARSLLQVLALFRRGGWMADDAIEEPPLRSELFSADQMEQHG